MGSSAVAKPSWAPRRLTVAIAVISLVALNLIDTIATIYATGLGGDELNPVMAWLLSHGPAAFVGGKMGFITLGALYLALYARRKRMAWYGLLGLDIVYGLVAVFHFYVIFILAR